MDEKLAIIDIGSNSIRLVIYEALGRIPVIIHNEKIASKLANNLKDTGNLCIEGKLTTEKALARFLAIISLYHIKNKIHIIATAAIRDAKDGDEFKNFLEEKFNTEIKLLSGKEEAKYTAKSIICGFDDPKGLAFDIGGGSLEISFLEDHNINNCESYPIGLLRIKDLEEEEQIILIKNNLANYPKLKVKDIYLSGGGFRSIAKLYILSNSYKLNIIHNFAVEALDLLAWLECIPKLDKRIIDNFLKKEEKDTKSLNTIITLLKEIIKYFCPKNILFSAFGIREGYYFSLLSNLEKQQDLQISSALNLAKKENFEGFGIIRKFLRELDIVDKNFVKYLDIAYILADIAKFDHNEYRAKIAFERILYSSLIGYTHQERCFLASILYFRYKSEMEKDISIFLESFIGKEIFEISMIIGYLIRFIYSFCSNEITILSKYKIIKKDNNLIFIADHYAEILISDMVEKRFQKLAKLLNCEAIISIL